MKTVFQTLAFLALGATVFVNAGCKMTCKDNEEEKGSECVFKSLKKFNGTAVTQQATVPVDGKLAVKGLFGHIKLVQGSNPGKIDVTFQPFDYEAYDEIDLATRQMNEKLGLKIIEGDPTIVQVERLDASTTGLGADVTVALPSDFKGKLELDNLGAGTVSTGKDSDFSISTAYVAGATELIVNGHAELSDCQIQGAASVVKTVVTCGKDISVLDVSDEVTIESREGSSFDDPSITLRLAGVSAGSAGGTLTTKEGNILATFPSSGDFAVQANAAGGGTVDFGTPPGTCQVAESSPSAKTLSCGAATPVYKLTNNGQNDNVYQKGNIVVSYK